MKSYQEDIYVHVHNRMEKDYNTFNPKLIIIYVWFFIAIYSVGGGSIMEICMCVSLPKVLENYNVQVLVPKMR